MAREGQGLQILVIIFVFLTMLLAFGTWYGMSNWATTAEVLGTTKEELKAERKLRADFNTEADVLRFMVGFGPYEQEEQFKQAVATLTTGATDATVQARAIEVQAQFDKDMDKIAGSAEGAPNWRTLSTKLIDVVSQKNGEVASLIKKQNDLVTLQKEDKKAYDSSLATAQKAAEQARADLEKVTKQAAEDKTVLTTAMQDAQAKTDDQGKETEKVRRTLTEKVTGLQTMIGGLETKVLEQAQAIRDLQPDDFDVAQGRITLSSPSAKMVWINLGSDDNLRPQISFAVYGQNVTKFLPENKKADIQIERIAGPHLAAARIVSTSLDNPILTDDFVHTPSWSPSRRLQFAIAGFFDLDGDSFNDQTRFKSILSINNGDVVAELTADGEAKGEFNPRIRYLIVGDPPRDANLLTKFGEYNQRAEKEGFDIRYYRDVLEQMGVRGEAGSARPGRDDGSGGFKKRRPPRKENGSFD